MRRILVILSFFVAVTATAAARDQMLVSTDWLAKHLRDVVVLDVSDRAAYAVGHIPGARPLDIKQIAIDVAGIPNELPPTETLEAIFTRAGAGGSKTRIVICGRDPLHAARVWFTLDYLGAGDRAAILDGGYAKWTAELRPTSRREPAAGGPEFTASVNPSAIVRYPIMRALVSWGMSLDNRFVLIDARLPEFFKGEKSGAGVTKPGHITGACNVPWSNNLTPGGTLRKEAELRDLYQGFGIDQNSQVVAYCRSGMEASLTYFVLRYLGYDAALYDGSYVEWTRNETSV